MVGGFIASAGLESYYAHGFITHEPTAAAPHPSTLVERTVAFVDYFLINYVRNVLPYVYAAYRVAQDHAHDLETALRALAWLDWQHHTLLLNHVARRASMIQGMALLSLYTKSFAHEDTSANTLIDHLRRNARRGSAQLHSGAVALQPERAELAGHLPICTGAFAACAGLSLERALRQNVFLQARNLLSCSIRLNTIGPYMAHRLLASELSTMVARHLRTLDHAACERLAHQAVTQKSTPTHTTGVLPTDAETWDWDWDDVDQDAPCSMPCTAWPLGEIVQARHDQLHSRLFNS